MEDRKLLIHDKNNYKCTIDTQSFCSGFSLHISEIFEIIILIIDIVFSQKKKLETIISYTKLVHP
jgi:hypothetical protein